MKFTNAVILICFAFLSLLAQPQKELGNSQEPAVSSTEKKSPISIPKVEKSPVIDGKIDEEIWNNAVVLKDFVQTSPGDNTEPSKPTEVLIAYDERNLYIAFRCWDERDKIRATFAKRDSILSEDNVRIYLDTYNDQRRAYLLGFNPYGIQLDGIYTEGQSSADYSVDIVMESKGIIEDWGWSVEVSIPFKSLRYSAGDGKFWGFNVMRTIVRLNNEVDEWMPRSREISGFLSQHGSITGFDEINTERTLEVIPSITFSKSGNRQAGNIFVNEPVQTDLSLSLKYAITPNVVLDAAINPDFAEVEADAPVVTANQRFPIFFPEKRPFFLEGADIFQTPLRLFNSRAIFDPDLAVKLTGKVSKNTFGFLGSIDNKRNLETKSYAGVLRIKRDFSKENNLGIFATTNHFPERHNSVIGGDGRIRFSDKKTLIFQVATTTTRGFFFNPSENRSEYRTGNGLAYYLKFDYVGRNRGLLFETEGRSKDYRADIGFSQRLNTNASRIRLRLATEPDPKAKLINTEWTNQVGYRFDWSGRLQNTYHNSSINFNLQRNTTLSVSNVYAYEKIYEDEFGARRTVENPNGGAFFGDPQRSAFNGFFTASVRTSPIKTLSGGFFFTYNWNSFDFDFGGGPRFPRVSPAALADPNAPLDPGKGTQWDFGGNVDYRPINPLRIYFFYQHSALKRNDTDQTVFVSNRFFSQTDYQFSRFIFARSRWDYDTLTSRVNGQLLFGWNPKPGKAIYVGYNDALRYRGFNPYIGQFTNGFERDGRTFFVRFSYLFRKSF